jgi:hypothetical protein
MIISRLRSFSPFRPFVNSTVSAARPAAAWCALSIRHHVVDIKSTRCCIVLCLCTDYHANQLGAKYPINNVVNIQTLSFVKPISSSRNRETLPKILSKISLPLVMIPRKLGLGILAATEYIIFRILLYVSPNI